MQPTTRFAQRYVRPTGALELMEDLGGAGPGTHMLGGGNPARIAKVEARYARRLGEIAADPTQFGRFAAAYAAPGGDLRFRARSICASSSLGSIVRLQRSSSRIRTVPSTYVNPAFETIYGFTREEALGRTPRILKSGLISQEQYQLFWEALLAGQTVAGEIVNRAKDGI